MGRLLAVTTLVLRALGLGDLLCAVPALRGVRRSLPGPVVLAGPAALGPVALLSGAVDSVLDCAPLGPVPAAAPAVAVNLHGRGPQSTARLRAAAPGRLLAYGVPGGPAWDDEEHERERWCRLLTWYGVPADPLDLALPVPQVQPPTRDAVLVHPGAAYGSRRWPPARWAAVARALGPVLLTGSAAERDLCLQVAAGAGLPPSAVLAGRTDLLELAALVAAARLVLCGDTGMAHLATAYGTPSVVLFGPAPPARWAPPPGSTQHRVLWSGRTGEVFSGAPDPGLLTLTVDDVLAALP